MNYDEFIDRYGNQIIRVVRSRLNYYNIRDKDCYKDICQNILLKIWKKKLLFGIHDSRKLISWVTVVASNETRTYCKTRIFNKPFMASINDDIVIAPDRPSQLDNRNKINFIKTIVNKFKETQRRVLYFTFFESMKQCDVAKMLGLPAGTVATYIKRGRETIKKEVLLYET